MAEEGVPRGIVIAPNRLSRAALRGMVEEFVTRDGTDYGAAEQSVAQKVEAVVAQLESGEARLVFDPETETTNIVLSRKLSEP